MFISFVCIFLWLLLFQIPLDLFNGHLIFRNWRNEATDVNPHEFMPDFQKWSNIACFILKWMGGLLTKISLGVIFIVKCMLLKNKYLLISNIVNLSSFSVRPMQGGWSNIPWKTITFEKDRPPPNWQNTLDDLQANCKKQFTRTLANASKFAKINKMHKSALRRYQIIEYDGQTFTGEWMISLPLYFIKEVEVRLLCW